MGFDRFDDAEERRKYIRLDTVFPIEFQLVDKEDRRPLSELGEGFTRDVGRGGMGIFAKTLKEHEKEFFNFIPHETKLKLVINIPLDKEPLECFAAVEWMEKKSGPIVDTYFFGVSYDFINDIQYEKIISYVKWLRLRPKLIFLTITLLAVAFMFSLVFLLTINIKRLESEKRLKESTAEIELARATKERAEKKKVDMEAELDAVKRKQLAIQAAFKKLAEEKESLEKISELSEEGRKELEGQLEELTKERQLLEEQIGREAAEAEEGYKGAGEGAGTEEPGKAKAIPDKRLSAEEANYEKFRELILNEKIQSLSAYVSSHRSSIYHAAALFALAELRYKQGGGALAEVNYNQIIEFYPRSKYALYSSHRLAQIRRNLPYETYTLNDFYNTYSLPELFDYRNIEPYLR